jgi:AcrR family transcriptional regulator
MLLKEQKRLDPRIKRTRQLLQQALLELMAERNFQSITVQDIAEKATVNRATFYAHYEDKFDLLDNYIREEFMQWLRLQLPPSSPFTLNSLRTLVLTVFQFLAKVHGDYKGADRQVESMIEASIHDELYELILSWFKSVPASDTRHRATPETAAAVMSWAIFGAGTQWTHSGRATPADVMADQVLEVFTSGLSCSLKAPFLEPRKNN